MGIIVAGGGIAGLSFALTCHELGIEVRVYEAVADLQPLGVGINLQPNAVRELIQLGLEEDLREIGIEAEEWALFFYGGHPIWTEPRGTLAGYRWPQFSVHRGQLQMRLVQRVKERLGPESFISDAQLLRYEQDDTGVIAHMRRKSGERMTVRGDLLIAADGINSSARAQMYPEQGEVNWNGAVMWRGVSRCTPPRTQNSFVMVGGISQRFICYPVEPLDGNGETLLNWIAELRPDGGKVDKSDWNQRASADAFMHAFTDWRLDWLDVPEIVAAAQGIWEYPMVDRDPVAHWVDDRVALIGDAAHAMFPHGSGGASQAIVDGRVLGACLREAGVTPEALQAYERRLLQPVNELVMRNRGEGPIGVLLEIEERLAQGQEIDEAIDQAAVAAFMASYKEAAGTAMDSLNASPPIIDPG
ncbi:MAG: flavin-dependent oxidoreductase [Pseudomonadota bacterium]